jgi:hypothetical protein
LEEEDRYNDGKLPVLSFDCVIEIAMSGILLEQVDHVLKVNKGVINSNSIHVARAKSSTDAEAPTTVKFIYFDFQHHVLGTRLPTQKMPLCRLRRIREEANISIKFIHK